MLRLIIIHYYNYILMKLLSHKCIIMEHIYNMFVTENLAFIYNKKLFLQERCFNDLMEHVIPV